MSNRACMKACCHRRHGCAAMRRRIAGTSVWNHRAVLPCQVAAVCPRHTPSRPTPLLPPTLSGASWACCCLKTRTSGSMCRTHRRCCRCGWRWTRRLLRFSRRSQAHRQCWRCSQAQRATGAQALCGWMWLRRVPRWPRLVRHWPRPRLPKTSASPRPLQLHGRMLRCA